MLYAQQAIMCVSFDTIFNQLKERKLSIYIALFMFFLTVLGFELRALHLLVRCPIT
jgi:hypothetical protein